MLNVLSSPNEKRILTKILDKRALTVKELMEELDWDASAQRFYEILTRLRLKFPQLISISSQNGTNTRLIVAKPIAGFLPAYRDHDRILYLLSKAARSIVSDLIVVGEFEYRLGSYTQKIKNLNRFPDGLWILDNSICAIEYESTLKSFKRIQGIVRAFEDRSNGLISSVVFCSSTAIANAYKRAQEIIFKNPSFFTPKLKIIDLSIIELGVGSLGWIKEVSHQIERSELWKNQQ